MSGQRLWAPWRMRYIQGGRTDEGYIFCLAAAASDDEARLVLHRAERCLVMLNAFLYNSGHLMVSPLRHAASIEDLDDDELLELMTLTRRALRAVRKTYGPDGFNLGVNEGEIAGAGFAGHVHLHVVPRWAADRQTRACCPSPWRTPTRSCASGSPESAPWEWGRPIAALVGRAQDGPIDVTLVAPAAWEGSTRTAAGTRRRGA